MWADKIIIDKYPECKQVKTDQKSVELIEVGGICTVCAEAKEKQGEEV